MPQALILNARVTLLESVDRQEHFDADGGGTISDRRSCPQPWQPMR